MILNNSTCCFWLSIGLIGLNAQVIAGTVGRAGPETSLYRPLATISLGPDFIQKGRAQTLTPIPPFQKHYTNTNTSTTAEDAGAFIGVEHAYNDKLWIQLGISGYIDAQITPRGDVWLFASPEFDALGYAYNVHHTRVMAEGKFLTTLNANQSFHPYISWQLGAAFNQAGNYQEFALAPGAVPTPPFANHTQTSFSWGVGIGADYALNDHVRIGAGYQFADLGSVSLGPTIASVNTETLTFPHLYTNQLRCQFTFVV